MTVLRLENASKQYLTDGAPVPALENVDIDVNIGELVAIVGRSGCGKSTLLHLAGAMDLPTSGRVFIDGAETSRLSDAALTRLRRDKVGFIFQSFQLLPTLTVVENVELPLLLAGRPAPRKAALERLAWVELDGLQSRFPHQLSGGQQQRVAIARALVHGPKLLLADEPIGNLDTATGEVVLRLLRRIVDEQRVTVLMATHSTESTAIAGIIVRLRDGRIEEITRPSGR
ncbi:MAG: ABC transporter ATP-binding protein [Bryobacteraceae bacterium]|nr:ABC transporter ATP-binding protein [Bryobacteraceae bacterium]